MNQTSAVTGGDHYLLPVFLHAVPGASSSDYYQLTVSPGISVYYHADKTGLLVNGATLSNNQPITSPNIPANVETPLYVEGRAYGTSATGPSVIRLNLSLSGVMTLNVDQARFNVFGMYGTLDVPGNGTYTYTADVTGGAWVDPTWGNALAANLTANPNSTDITWNNAAELGYANYQANPSYVWSCGVNIVGISDAPSAGSAHEIDYGGMPTQSATNALVINDGNLTSPALTVHVAVTLHGWISPSDTTNTQRGVQYINVGVIQDARIASLLTTYSEGETRYFNLAGDTLYNDYADTIAGGVVVHNPGPWYWLSNVSPSHGDPSGQPPMAPFNFTFRDAPQLPFSNTWVGLQGADDVPYLVSMRSDFRIFIAAQSTKGPATGASGASGDFTPEAEAIWTFDGSGSLSDHVWTPGATATNGGDRDFSPEPADGAAMVATGASANSVYRAGAFLWQPSL
jgi:hypothetical protein